NMDMSMEKKQTRQELGSLLRFPGGIVPAPGRSTPEALDPGDSSEGPAAGLPTGPAAELVTVRNEAREGGSIQEGDAVPTTSHEVENVMTTTPKKRKELRLRLDRAGVRIYIANVPAAGPKEKAPTFARAEAPFPRRGRPRKYPKEMRIRVVEGEIVNSPIAESVSVDTPVQSGSTKDLDIVDLSSCASSVEGTGVETEQGDSTTGGEMIPSTAEDSGDLSSSFDQVPRKGKKRGRKPKGTNCPGSHALSKLSSKRMDYEDDELDRIDFFKVTKKDGHGLKKRKGLVECNLDDRLTSGQKDAIEEITMLFPQMSPKTMMVETLRVLEIAGEAERKTQSMKGDFRRHIKVGERQGLPTISLEREIVKLRQEVYTLRRERTTMNGQIKALQQTVEELREESRRRSRDRSRALFSEGEAHGGRSPVRTRGRAREEHTVRDRGYEPEGVRRESEDRDLPPAYRPPIGGTRKRLEDGPSRPTKVDEDGRIVTDTGRPTSGQRGDSYADRTRAGLERDDGELGLGGGLGPESSIPPSDYPASGEAWTEAQSKRARKRARKKVRKDPAPEEIRTEKSAGKGLGRAGMPPPPDRGWRRRSATYRSQK
ncbi:hypothetical protein ALC57_09877, partial [Trachymyrmex cornetzi]